MNKLFEKSQKQLVSEDNLIKEDNGNQFVYDLNNKIEYLRNEYDPPTT